MLHTGSRFAQWNHMESLDSRQITSPPSMRFLFARQIHRLKPMVNNTIYQPEWIQPTYFWMLQPTQTYGKCASKLPLCFSGCDIWPDHGQFVPDLRCQECIYSRCHIYTCPCNRSGFKGTKQIKLRPKEPLSWMMKPTTISHKGRF